MESEEDKNEIKSNQSELEIDAHSKLVVISSHNDKIFVHVNKIQINNQSESENTINYHIATMHQAVTEIIDVNSVTRKLTNVEISKLTLESIIDIKIDEISNRADSDENEEEQLDESKNKEEDERGDFGLKEREKNQKFTHQQLLFIKSKSNDPAFTAKLMSIKFNLSVSQINKIKRMNLDQIDNRKIRAYIKLTKSEKKLLLSSIDRFYRNTNHAFNAKEVADYVNSSLNKNYPLYFIRRFMKSEINLSYKRVKPRPVSWNFEKLKHVRLLFAVEFWKRIKPETLIINIDESSINRHIQRNSAGVAKDAHEKQ